MDSSGTRHCKRMCSSAPLERPPGEADRAPMLLEHLLTDGQPQAGALVPLLTSGHTSPVPEFFAPGTPARTGHVRSKAGSKGDIPATVVEESVTYRVTYSVTELRRPHRQPDGDQERSVL